MVCRIMFLITACFFNLIIKAQNLWSPYHITPRTGKQHIDLSGKWELSHTDKPIGQLKDLEKRKEPFETVVPNSIHWSLYKAGKLPHPYANKNSSLYKWVDEKAWYYRKTLTIPATARGNLTFLCFDGIDYFSKVWFRQYHYC